MCVRMCIQLLINPFIASSALHNKQVPCIVGSYDCMDLERKCRNCETLMLLCDRGGGVLGEGKFWEVGKEKEQREK